MVYYVWIYMRNLFMKAHKKVVWMCPFIALPFGDINSAMYCEAEFVVAYSTA